VPEPPETATPELDDELTVPEEGCREPDELLVDDELEEAELDAAEVVVVEAVPDDDEVEVPGMVSAPTVPKMPTPATAAKAMPAVSWLSRDRALSRARILASEGFVCSTLVRMLPPSQSSM